MAAVLDALAPYVKKLLQDMAQEEVSMLLGVSSEITKLEDNMEGLRYFLADAERRRIIDRAVQRWVSKLTNAMYDVTDILDLCLLEADKRSEPSKHSRLEEKVPAGCLQSLLFCLRNRLFTHDMGSRIRQLNQRLDGIHKEAYRNKFNISLSSNPEPRKLTAAELSSYRTSSHFDQSVIVGEQIQKDTKELALMLITSNGNHNIKVVSIIGIAGIGKTILAQTIFNEPTIQEHFSCKIWLSITQVFDESELLRTAIKHAGGDYGGQEDKSILMDMLVHALSTAGRFLLVMDDVWSMEAWNHVLCVPVRIASKKQPGSRVIVTTRSAHIPRQMQAPLHQHRVRPLDKDDAWCLLKKQLQPDQVVEIDHLKDIGMEFLKKCDGLPLAIKVVGGLLSTRYPSEHEWESVLNTPAWSLIGLPPELDNKLYLSYENLSPQLKQCFLYCSLFPKGQKLVQRTITEMWVSEGFITTSLGEHEPEDIAIEYYRELIKWNFIEPTENYSLTGYMCSMNNVVHSFAQFMACEEALVVQREQRIGSIGGQSNLPRRLSIESTESIPVEWAALQNLVSLRVLIINCKINFKPGDSLSSFSSLRVLHIVRLSESDKLVRSLCQLKHLRYLYLYESDISRLPSNIDQMKFLQYIGIINCERFVQLPGNIIKLRHLRSLDLVGSSVDVIPRGFGSLTNLRSLFGFPVHTDDKGWCSLEELAPLSQLRSLRLELEGMEKMDASHLAANALISRKQHLSSLQLNYSSTSGSSNISNLEQQQQQQQQQLIQEVYEHLTPPPCLETLVMEEYIGHRLPNWMWAPKAVSLLSLRYMSLHNLANCTHLPDGLCQIPSLERLEINKAPLIRHVRPEFLHHGRLGYAFPKLQELVLYDMVEWSEWEWNDVEAMPAMEVLLVKSCKLRSLPPGLSYHARALRRAVINGARLLESLEDFSSLVELEICFSPKLSKIVRMPRLQKLTIKICPKLRVLEDAPALISLVVEDYEMKTLPGYLLAVHPWYLTLDCSKKLLKSIAMGEDGPEWNKISHIQHVRAYAEDGGYQRKCSVLYTREPYSLVVNTLLDDSEEKLTDDKRVGSDTPSGSTENLTDDELVGSDIPSGSNEDPFDNELAGSDIPSGSTGEDLLNYNDSELVGIESPREEIIKMLMHGQATNDQLRVVSICGPGGLGKTSVAKSVYKNIANQFECTAFISVSQGPADDDSIIQRIFDKVGCRYPSSEECVSHQQLIDTLKEFLQDKRYLIVVDDICDVSVWEMIKPALIDNNNRSGIIATTYKVVVAESIGGVYKLPLLSDDDSKILFYRKTYFKTENGCSSEYRESTKRILNKCGRLALAIITFASLLPNDSPNSPEEWKKVADSIGSGSFELDDRVKNMRRILSRSYDNLPQHLRTCFLYLCTVPEDYVIRRDSLVKRWISEDLIQGNDGQNLQEMGERYFYELLDTGMIQPIEHDYDGKALACRVPVLMTDLIFSFANKQENRSSEEGTIKSFWQTSLSISYSGDCKEDTDARPGKLRLFARSWATYLASRKKYLKINKNLRVLELEGSLEEQDIANYIGSSHQLRYLVIASTQITAIPRRVGNLQFLQALDLRATSVHELPCTIVILKQLRCLLINRSTKVPAGISKLQALEELQDIDTTPDILESICTLPELRFLRIAVRSWDESCGKPLPDTLCKLSTTKLKQLSICTSYSLGFKPGDIRKVLQHVEKLEIQHSTFGTLPTWIKGPSDESDQAHAPDPPLTSAPPTQAPPAASASEQVEPHQTPPPTSAPPTTQAPPAASSSEQVEPHQTPPPTSATQAPPAASSSEQVEPHQTPRQSDGRSSAKTGGSISGTGAAGSSTGTRAAWAEPSQMRPDNGFKKLSYLSIEVYLLEMEGLKILAGLPELIFLSLTAKGPTAQRAPKEMVATAKLDVPNKGFKKLKIFHLFSRAIGIKFQQGSMKNLEKLKLSFQAAHATDDFSFGVENLSSLKQVQVEIICFSATKKEVEEAEDAVRVMILGNLRLPRSALDIRKTEEEYMIEDKGEVKAEVKEEFIGEVKEEVKEEVKGEVKEEVKDELKGKIKEEVKEELMGKIKEEVKEELIGEFRELFLAALDRRVPLAQKEKEKEKEKGKERIALAQEEEEKQKNA